MTRNTKFYKVKIEINNQLIDIYYRDLTVNELCALNNIKSYPVRCEFAAELAVTNYDVSNLSYALKMNIGEDVIENSSKELSDQNILDVTIAEFKEKVENDPVLIWISHITKYFPGTSIVDLFKLKPKDLIELVVLSEAMGGQDIFNNKKKGINFVNPGSLSKENRKALTDQIRDLNNSIGIQR